MTTVADTRRAGQTNERVELARYTVSAGERVIHGQRILGVVRLVDNAACGEAAPTSSSANSSRVRARGDRTDYLRQAETRRLWASDSYGFVLAAHAGQSQGRPDTSTSSQLKGNESACPLSALP